MKGQTHPSWELYKPPIFSILEGVTPITILVPAAVMVSVILVTTSLQYGRIVRQYKLVQIAYNVSDAFTLYLSNPLRGILLTNTVTSPSFIPVINPAHSKAT